MNNKTEYKYNWTRKLEDGSFLKVGGDTVDEVMLGMDELEARVGNKSSMAEKPLESHPEASKPIVREQIKEPLETAEDWCGIHDCKMFPREGKYGTFYSHSKGEYPDKQYCNGKGFK